jgi:hypothetical protein
MTIVLTIVYQMWLFSCFRRWEYENHREQWERDIKPTGLHLLPKSWMRGAMEKHLYGIWLFKTPDWAATSPKCCRWLMQMRVAALIGYLGMAVFFVILFR